MELRSYHLDESRHFGVRKEGRRGVAAATRLRNTPPCIIRLVLRRHAVKIDAGVLLHLARERSCRIRPSLVILRFYVSAVVLVAVGLVTAGGLQSVPMKN
jgi:hypothetical protein